MGTDSAGATLYAALRDAVINRLARLPVLGPLANGSPHGDLFAPWFDLPGRLNVALHTILAAAGPFGADLRALIHAALEEACLAIPPTWGQRHRFQPLHALEQFGLPHQRTTPSTPLPGDTDTVFATAYLPGRPGCVRGPVARYVWDLAGGFGTSSWAVPLGASGRPDDPHHHDQHRTWTAGGVLPIEENP
jgi:penicillin amidase